MMKTRSKKDTAVSSTGDGLEEANATALVAEEYVRIQGQEDSEETLSAPRGQAVQAVAGSEELKTMILLLQDISVNIKTGLRTVMEKLDDNKQQALDTHQATMDKITRNQELLLEKVQSGGGSTPVVPVEDTFKALERQSPKISVQETDQRPGKQASETYQPPHKREEITKNNGLKVSGHT